MIRAWVVGILWQKEWRNSARDRRVFWLNMLMPLLVPVLMFLLIPLLIGTLTPRLKGDLLTIGVQGEMGRFEQSLSLPQQSALKLVGVKPVKLVPVRDARAAVQSGELGMAGFHFAQLQSAYHAMRVAVTTAHVAFVNPRHATSAMDAVSAGWIMGRQWKNIHFVKWEEQLDRPLADIRAECGGAVAN